VSASDDCWKADDSIRVHRKFDSNEIDESNESDESDESDR
jgi:hypothetical protein